MSCSLHFVVLAGALADCLAGSGRPWMPVLHCRREGRGILGRDCFGTLQHGGGNEKHGLGWLHLLL